VRVYCSAQAHSSIDKAVRISGIGDANLVRIPVTGDRFAMDVAALDRAIQADREAGYRPAAIVACLGGTSVGACDDIAAVAAVARRHDLFLHVDAAWAAAR
jgi:aromatic-L-amino-acid decarboxylase